MLIGFDIIPNDINQFIIEDINTVNKKYDYSNTYEYDLSYSKLIIKQRKVDIGVTYDGFTIVSRQFKNLCEQYRFDGLIFIPLPADLEFYVLRVQNILEFDSVSRRTQFIGFNNSHNSYREVRHAPRPVREPCGRPR